MTVLANTPATGLVLGKRRRREGGHAAAARSGRSRWWMRPGPGSRLVAELMGARIPVVPTRHQLFITEPIDGITPAMPIARVIDANVYIRHERGGLMLGGYEPNPKQYDLGATRAELPDQRPRPGHRRAAASWRSSVRGPVPDLPGPGPEDRGAPRRPAHHDRGRPLHPGASPRRTRLLAADRLLRRRAQHLAGAGRGAGAVDRGRQPADGPVRDRDRAVRRPRAAGGRAAAASARAYSHHYTAVFGGEMPNRRRRPEAVGSPAVDC